MAPVQFFSQSTSAFRFLLSLQNRSILISSETDTVGQIQAVISRDLTYLHPILKITVKSNSYCKNGRNISLPKVHVSLHIVITLCDCFSNHGMQSELNSPALCIYFPGELERNSVVGFIGWKGLEEPVNRGITGFSDFVHRPEF
jgi:hypothetical protein